MTQTELTINQKIEKAMASKKVVRVETYKKVYYDEDGISIWEMKITCMSGEQTLQTYQYSHRQKKVFYSEHYVFDITECHHMHQLLLDSCELGRGEQFQYVLQLNGVLLVQVI